MKKEDLEIKIKELEKDARRSSDTSMLNLHYDVTKLFVEIINDFNEKTEVYNRRLPSYIIAICFLTIVMTI